MKQIRCLAVLTGAAALVACASQAPAPSAANADHGAALVASQRSTPATAPPATASLATTSATAQNIGFKIPSGLTHKVINGEDVYCETWFPTGTRVLKQESCLTKAQLQNRQLGTQALMDRISQTAAYGLGNTMGAVGATGQVGRSNTAP